MYDPRTEPREFAGETREEAVAKAAGFFGTGEEGLTIREFPDGAVFGATSRVVIVAFPSGAARPARRSEGGERERGGRERGTRDRGGRDRGGRERRGGDGPRRERRERREERDRGGAREAEPADDIGPSIGTAVGELSETGQYVLGLVERLEIGSFELSESEDGGNLVFQIRGPAASRLCGGDGRGIGAVQLLAGQVSMRQDEEHRRVIIDVDGESDRRGEQLVRAAERAVKRARETGRGVALEPMNGRDRRLVHVALRDTPGIATMSVGEGRYRQVVVVPEGAPEYEEALQHEAAAREESDS